MLRFRNSLLYWQTKKFSVHIFILPGRDVMYILSLLVCLACTQISFYALWCWKRSLWCDIRGR